MDQQLLYSRYVGTLQRTIDMTSEEGIKLTGYVKVKNVDRDGDSVAFECERIHTGEQQRSTRKRGSPNDLVDAYCRQFCVAIGADPAARSDTTIAVKVLFQRLKPIAAQFSGGDPLAAMNTMLLGIRTPIFTLLRAAETLLEARMSDPIAANAIQKQIWEKLADEYPKLEQELLLAVNEGETPTMEEIGELLDDGKGDFVASIEEAGERDGYEYRGPLHPGSERGAGYYRLGAANILARLRAKLLIAVRKAVRGTAGNLGDAELKRLEDQLKTAEMIFQDAAERKQEYDQQEKHHAKIKEYQGEIRAVKEQLKHEGRKKERRALESLMQKHEKELQKEEKKLDGCIKTVKHWDELVSKKMRIRGQEYDNSKNLRDFAKSQRDAIRERMEASRDSASDRALADAVVEAVRPTVAKWSQDVVTALAPLTSMKMAVLQRAMTLNPSNHEGAVFAAMMRDSEAAEDNAAEAQAVGERLQLTTDRVFEQLALALETGALYTCQLCQDLSPSRRKGDGIHGLCQWIDVFDAEVHPNCIACCRKESKEGVTVRLSVHDLCLQPLPAFMWLGLHDSANSGDVRKQFRQLSKVQHPQRGNNMDDHWQLTQVMHRMLGDQGTLQLYLEQRNHEAFLARWEKWEELQLTPQQRIEAAHEARKAGEGAKGSAKGGKASKKAKVQQAAYDPSDPRAHLEAGGGARQPGSAPKREHRALEDRVSSFKEMPRLTLTQLNPGAEDFGVVQAQWKDKLGQVLLAQRAYYKLQHGTVVGHRSPKWSEIYAGPKTFHLVDGLKDSDANYITLHLFRVKAVAPEDTATGRPAWESDWSAPTEVILDLKRDDREVELEKFMAAKTKAIAGVKRLIHPRAEPTLEELKSAESLMRGFQFSHQGRRLAEAERDELKEMAATIGSFAGRLEKIEGRRRGLYETRDPWRRRCADLREQARESSVNARAAAKMVKEYVTELAATKRLLPEGGLFPDSDEHAMRATIANMLAQFKDEYLRLADELQRKEKAQGDKEAAIQAAAKKARRRREAGDDWSETAAVKDTRAVDPAVTAARARAEAVAQAEAEAEAQARMRARAAQAQAAQAQAAKERAPAAAPVKRKGVAATKAKQQQQAQQQQHAKELARVGALNQVANTLGLEECPPLDGSEAANAETLHAWTQSIVSQAGDLLGISEDAKQGSLAEQVKACIRMLGISMEEEGEEGGEGDAEAGAGSAAAATSDEAGPVELEAVAPATPEAGDDLPSHAIVAELAGLLDLPPGETEPGFVVMQANSMLEIDPSGTLKEQAELALAMLVGSASPTKWEKAETKKREAKPPAPPRPPPAQQPPPEPPAQQSPPKPPAQQPPPKPPPQPQPVAPTIAAGGRHPKHWGVFNIRSDSVGYFLGKKGETHRKLMDHTGTKIKISNADPRAGPSQVQIVEIQGASAPSVDNAIVTIVKWFGELLWSDDPEQKRRLALAVKAVAAAEGRAEGVPARARSPSPARAPSPAPPPPLPPPPPPPPKPAAAVQRDDYKQAKAESGNWPSLNAARAPLPAPAETRKADGADEQAGLDFEQVKHLADILGLEPAGEGPLLAWAKGAIEQMNVILGEEGHGSLAEQVTLARQLLLPDEVAAEEAAAVAVGEAGGGTVELIRAASPTPSTSSSVISAPERVPAAEGPPRPANVEPVAQAPPPKTVTPSPRPPAPHPAGERPPGLPPPGLPHSEPDASLYSSPAPSVAAAPAVGLGAFTIASLAAACKGWSPAVRLGQRETCETYRGVLPSGTPIAVQRVRTVSGQAWQAELDEMMRSNVSHPNIVQLLGLTSDGPTACVVYAYMDGGSLGQRLRAAPGQAPLSASARLLALCDAARGLAFLHDLGVVHRHVRPSNILLDRSGGAKIRDGCVARAFESYKESEDESAFIFKAPEYLRGGAPTTKVDSYALGLTILETVTGRAAERPTESFATLLELAEDAFLDEDDPAPLRSRADPNDGAEGETWRPFHREVATLYGIVLACLEKKMRRAEVSALVPRFEEMRSALENIEPDVPGEFLCPITHEVMVDPVVAADGETYERKAIAEWLRRNQTSPTLGTPAEREGACSPCRVRHASLDTALGTPMADKMLRENRLLKMLIQRHLAK